MPAAFSARRGAFGLVALAVGGLLALLGAQAASAHADLLSTTPRDGAVLAQMPAEAVLHFSEAVRPVAEGIVLTGGRMPVKLTAQVAQTDAVVALPALGDGAYSLSFRMVSDDGHPIAGVVGFTVGVGAVPHAPAGFEVPVATATAVRVLTGLQYVGLLVLSGLVLFERLVLRAVSPGTRLERIVFATACGVAVTSSVLLIPASAMQVIGLQPWQILPLSAWWPGVLQPVVSSAAVVLTGVAIVTMWRASGIERRTGLGVVHRAVSRTVPVIGGLMALWAPVLVGHTRSVQPRALLVIADLGHLAAGGFWVGGVVGLLLIRLRVGEGGVGLMLAAEAVGRFSRYAVVSVLVLIVSGCAMGVAIVGRIDALVSGSYGWLLLLKLAVVALALVIAARNHRRLVPGILAQPSATGGWRALRRALAHEATLLTAVLVITGVLTNLSPR